MDFKVKSSITVVYVVTHVFKFLFTPDTNDYQHYWKIKKSRYCWGIGVYVDLSQGSWKVTVWPLDELEIR